ncbi:hypothetical protein KQX54_011293 [Cotesia glomerata]|uniref:Uncharacterized protein n=1 Tax=Cotesia glomerata TaxID=32391 RepID=A0AAV7IRR0_COTGL|nr:hypothetical protein KQX54_011293 [Cotesia glomerata]
MPRIVNCINVMNQLYRQLDSHYFQELDLYRLQTRARLHQIQGNPSDNILAAERNFANQLYSKAHGGYLRLLVNKGSGWLLRLRNVQD